MGKIGDSKPAENLPSGFLSEKRAHGSNFERVGFAFAFRTVDKKVDFVFISVHLRPSSGLLNAKAKQCQHELGIRDACLVFVDVFVFGRCNWV